jgi:SAM-dependent methyltransferase
MLVRALRAVGLAPTARWLWKRAKAFGVRYRCPFCGGWLKAFLPAGFSHPVLAEKDVIGGGQRSNAVCPVCFSLDRERLLYLYLASRPHLLPAGAKVLHVAPELRLSSWLRGRTDIDCATADLNMPGVDYRIDLTAIPFPDETFHAIICSHVLEHIPDDAKAMREMRRVLKPGGWAILQTPISASLAATYEDFSITDPKERERAFGQDDHVRIYAMDYVDRLKAAGFSVEPFVWESDRARFGGAGNRFGLIERERVFFVMP